MPVDQYDIFFSGTCLPGEDTGEVRQNLTRLLNANQQTMDALFSGKEFRLKQGIGLDEASRFRLAFREAGALIDIRDSSETAPPQPDQTTAPAQSTETAGPGSQDTVDMQLLPPKTGNLEEFAPEIESAPIPDISQIDMAAPGAVIDESAPPPEAQIDTGSLSALPPQSGDLSDCVPDIEPLEIPDISHIKIVDENEN